MGEIAAKTEDSPSSARTTPSASSRSLSSASNDPSTARPSPAGQDRRPPSSASMSACGPHHHVDEGALTLTRGSDSMPALVNNDRNLTPEQVLDSHKRQHGVERRSSDAKSGLGIAPMLLKNPGRIDTTSIIDFLTLITSGLIEREIRHAMTHHHNPSERYTDA